MPRSPWLASPGWTKKAGVPVEAKVAAILRPTWPDLPMPVTITRPRAPRIRSTAATKARPSPSWMAAESAAMPPASASSVRTADAIKVALVCRSFGLCSSGFGMSDMIGTFAPRLQGRHGPGGTRGNRQRQGGQRPVNHIRSNFVNQSLSAAARVRWRGCRRAVRYPYNVLISSGFRRARHRAGTVSRDFEDCRCCAAAEHRSRSRFWQVRCWPRPPSPCRRRRRRRPAILPAP